MSWDDYDDYGDYYDRPRRPRRRRRRRRYYDYDDYDPPYGRDYYEPQSGAVTAVAVFNFVMGSIMLIFGSCVFFIIMVASSEARRRGQFDDFILSELGISVIAFAVAFLVWGGLILVAGFGVVYRKQWGRILTLVLGPIGLGLGVYLIVLGILALKNLSPNPLAVFLCFGGAFMLVIHCILAYSILFTRTATSEFD